MPRLPSKPNENRNKNITKEQATEYTQSSFKSIRAALKFARGIDKANKT